MCHRIKWVIQYRTLKRLAPKLDCTCKPLWLDIRDRDTFCCWTVFPCMHWWISHRWWTQAWRVWSCVLAPDEAQFTAKQPAQALHWTSRCQITTWLLYWKVCQDVWGKYAVALTDKALIFCEAHTTFSSHSSSRLIFTDFADVYLALLSWEASLELYWAFTRLSWTLCRIRTCCFHVGHVRSLRPFSSFVSLRCARLVVILPDDSLLV